MSEWLQFFLRALPDFWQGTLVTLQLTVVGLTMGFVLGLLSALARVYSNTWLRWLAVGYIELFRGTPVLLQLFFWFNAVPLVFKHITIAVPLIHVTLYSAKMTDFMTAPQC